MKHGSCEPINLLDKSLFSIIFAGLTLLKPVFSSPYFVNRQEVNRILVIRPGGFGDMLLALPFFRMLKLTFPDATIDLVCMRRNVGVANIFDEELGFSNIFLLEKDIFRFFNNKYDLAFSLDQSKYLYIIPVLMGLLSARVKIGYDIGRRARFCTHKMVYRHDEHEAQCSLNGFKYFGIAPSLNEEDLHFSCLPQLKKMANSSLGQYGLESGKFIACSLGGLNPQNKLPERIVRDVLAKLCKEDKCPLVVLGSAADSANADSLTFGIDGSIRNLCGRTSLKETIGILSHAGVFFGYDGGPLHMAVAAGCKTVSVWGPSLFDKWAPQFSDRHLFVRRSLACQPCLNGRFPIYPGCPFNRECLVSLDADEIVTKVFHSMGWM